MPRPTPQERERASRLRQLANRAGETGLPFDRRWLESWPFGDDGELLSIWRSARQRRATRARGEVPVARGLKLREGGVRR